jgi:hypothetical protein
VCCWEPRPFPPRCSLCLTCCAAAKRARMILSGLGCGPKTVSQHRFWPGGLRSVVAGRCARDPAGRKGYLSRKQGPERSHGCEGPQPSRSIALIEAQALSPNLPSMHVAGIHVVRQSRDCSRAT